MRGGLFCDGSGVVQAIHEIVGAQTMEELVVWEAVAGIVEDRLKLHLVHGQNVVLGNTNVDQQTEAVLNEANVALLVSGLDELHHNLESAVEHKLVAGALGDANVGKQRACGEAHGFGLETALGCRKDKVEALVLEHLLDGKRVEGEGEERTERALVETPRLDCHHGVQKQRHKPKINQRLAVFGAMGKVADRTRELVEHDGALVVDLGDLKDDRDDAALCKQLLVRLGDCEILDCAQRVALHICARKIGAHRIDHKVHGPDVAIQALAHKLFARKIPHGTKCLLDDLGILAVCLERREHKRQSALVGDHIARLFLERLVPQCMACLLLHAGFVLVYAHRLEEGRDCLGNTERAAVLAVRRKRRQGRAAVLLQTRGVLVLVHRTNDELVALGLDDLEFDLGGARDVCDHSESNLLDLA
eukprot:comp19756_c0_seq2/m.38092 comp19756_c0_seq2/g.38092  ORF comp19756_c0_seq2/g.38092 comp19756_c0_seq2/m.38092 type:complete len:418 (+) comp19756_c0_seq2:244-1497(+)